MPDAISSQVLSALYQPLLTSEFQSRHVLKVSDLELAQAQKQGLVFVDATASGHVNVGLTSKGRKQVAALLPQPKKPVYNKPVQAHQPKAAELPLPTSPAPPKLRLSAFQMELVEQALTATEQALGVMNPQQRNRFRLVAYQRLLG